MPKMPKTYTAFETGRMLAESDSKPYILRRAAILAKTRKSVVKVHNQWTGQFIKSFDGR